MWLFVFCPKNGPEIVPSRTPENANFWSDKYCIIFLFFTTDYKDLSSTDGSEYEPSLAYKYQMGERVKKERKKKRSEDESDYDIPEEPEPPRFTSSGRVSKKPQKYALNIP